MAERNILSNLDVLAAEFDMLPRGGVVLCAVSGGADSVCLLHRLAALRETGGFALAAAHFNHRLRGEESERDEVFVRNLVAALGGERVALFVGGGDVRARAGREGMGLEETARAMRYAFLRETAESLGADRIATAHTLDDNAETILLHLIRGTGLQGLTGIAPRRGELVRPLLTTPRSDVEQYLRENNLPHVEDSSNADDRFARNRVRHRLIPLLEELNPGFSGRMGDTARYLRADNDFLNAQAARICQNARWAEDDLVIEARYIAEAPAAIAPRAARRLLEMMGDGDTDCSAAHLSAIVELCRGEDPSAVTFLPGGRMAQRVYKELLLTTQSDSPGPLAAFAPRQGANPVPGTGWTAVLEGPLWPGLELRARRTGDEITLPRRTGKTVKKLFIEEKIPRRERERIPVLADSDGVVALAGFGINTAHPRCGTLAVHFIHSTDIT